VGIPFLHLGDATAAAVRAAGLTKVGLLGTAFTMEQEFYRARLAGHGLDVVTPDADDRQVVHQIIYDELCVGLIQDASRQAYRDVIARLCDAGAQGVILGCTEIELLISQADVAVPVFPTTRIHAEAAVAEAIARDPSSAVAGTGPR
jgi:aspartate racemase